MTFASSPERPWLTRDWDQQPCQALAEAVGVPLAIAVLLRGRGIDSPEQAEAFLHPSLQDLPPPELMKGMAEAVDLVLDGLAQRQRIIVVGDYDADGITGAAVLCLFLRELGADVAWELPHRFHDGYGLRPTVLARLHERHGPGLLITVDCGISDYDEVAQARALGYRVIITDHHQPPTRLPPADAILNPSQPGCPYPYKELAGVGVVFYLTMGIRSRLRRDGFWQEPGEIPNLKALMDLVAIGTVADLVPLRGPNRIFVRAGLETFATRPRTGLTALATTAGLAGPAAVEDITFRLAPRLNAVGRIGDAGKALEILTATDPCQAASLAASIEADNQERRLIQEQVAGAAVALARQELARQPSLLLLHDAAWHPGVLGVVATRLVEIFGRPCILMSGSGPFLKGSGRSVPGLNLHELLHDCRELLAAYGGHAMAAGLSLRLEDLAAFRARIDRLAAERLLDLPPADGLWIDWQAGLAELGRPEFLESYARLGPFGRGNPEPVFATAQGVRLTEATPVKSHLRFAVQEDGRRWTGIGFGMAGYAPRLQGEAAQLAFHLRRNSFRGIQRWEMQLSAVRFLG
ncbi:MAG: single-stranded-DNA-specific exonuclease RecJ [Thermodesulfobacteriota bacterium]